MNEAGLDISWIQVATAAGFAGLAWYLILRALPALVRDFREDLAAERALREAQGKAFIVALEQERAALRAEIDRLTSFFERQMQAQRQMVHEVLDRLEGAVGAESEG